MGILVLGNLSAALILVISLTIIDAIMEEAPARLAVRKFASDIIAAIACVAAFLTSVHFVNKVGGDSEWLGYVFVIIYLFAAVAYGYAYIIVCELAKGRRREAQLEAEQAAFDAKWSNIFKMIDLKNNTPE